jgi:hypothetical protein
MWQLRKMAFTRSIFTSRGDVLRRNFSDDIKCSRKTLLSRFASTAVCISLSYSSRSQSVDNTVSVATLHQVPRYMMYHFFLFLCSNTSTLSTFDPAPISFELPLLLHCSPPILLAGGLGFLAGYCCCCCRPGFRVLVSSSVSQL